MNKADEALEAYEKVCNVKGEVVTSEPLSEFVLRKKPKIRKVLAMVTAEQKQAVYQKAKEELGDEFYVTYSAAFLVEVTSKQYSKGTAVRFLADYYHVPIEKTIAVGDSLNDLPMLTAAGLGLAVKNADAALKEQVRTFPYTNDENAVGRIIAEYGFLGEDK